MANRTSNRAARRLFGGSTSRSIRLSNRRTRYFLGSEYAEDQYSLIEYKKPSRSQKRARRLAELDVWANLHKGA